MGIGITARAWLDKVGLRSRARALKHWYRLATGGMVEISSPTQECPEPQLWRCFDWQSAEIEVVEFLAQLVRTLKPKLIVETGTFRGVVAAAMAKALFENKRGTLITFEVDAQSQRIARKAASDKDVKNIIDFRLQSSLEGKVDGIIDLLFLDSLPTIRVAELRHFWDNLDFRSIIAIHDVNSGDHAELRAQVLEVDESRELSVVLLPTPRGLALCQKRARR
jgi:predicted O-methyltransferase YrrM